MRHEGAASAVRHRGLAAAAALAVALLTLPAGVASAEEPTPRSIKVLLADLRSPLGAVRADAEAEIVARGPAALPTVRLWSADDDPRLRAAAWRILGRVGAAEDLVGARGALRDEQASVGQAAADALVRLAGRSGPPRRPAIPRGTLSPGAARRLCLPLARRLDQAPAGAPPACLFVLGEGIVPCLEMICLHPRFGLGERERAMEALARIGGDKARRIVASLGVNLAKRSGQSNPPPAKQAQWLPRGWWSAINEVGCGPGLADAHALVVGIAAAAVARGRPWIRGVGWRDQIQFYRFIAACPPPEGIESVRELLDDLVEWAAKRRPMFPSAMVDIVRAHLVVSDPTDVSLADLVRCAVPNSKRRRRVEELGSVLALVATFKERPGVEEAVDEIIEERWDDLPDTVQAWALYIQGSTPVETLQERATALIRGDGAATVAQRRLGARLWQREELGLPPLALIRELLVDLDPWMRAAALGWAIRASRQGLLPKAEVAETLTRALSDKDDSVMLYAAGSRRVWVPEAVRARLLRLAVQGPRGVRDRAWRVLGALPWDERDSAAPAFTPPPAGAALDARIRAASAFRRDTGD